MYAGNTLRIGGFAVTKAKSCERSKIKSYFSQNSHHLLMKADERIRILALANPDAPGFLVWPIDRENI